MECACRPPPGPGPETGQETAGCNASTSSRVSGQAISRAPRVILCPGHLVGNNRCMDFFVPKQATLTNTAAEGCTRPLRLTDYQARGFPLTRTETSCRVL